MLLPPRLRSLETRRLLSRAPPPALRRRRPLLEGLEDRRLLATIVVNNPTDTPVAGQTDLRQAIALADATAPTRSPSTRASSAPRRRSPSTRPTVSSRINSDVTITGPSVGVTIARSTAAGTPDFRIMEVNSGVTATLENLTITGGNAGSSGAAAAIFNSGTLTLTNSTLSGNSAGNGGGIENYGTADADQLHPVGQLGPRRRRHLQQRHADADQLHPVGQLGLPPTTGRRRHRQLRHADADQLHPLGQLGRRRRRRHRQLRHGDADQLHPVGQLGRLRGGGIVNSGTATLTNSTLSGNSANRRRRHRQRAARLTLTNCTLSGNSAAATAAASTTTAR